MTQLQNAEELKILEARRKAAEETTSLAFEAWLATLSRIRARVESGALTKTEKKLSLAAMALIEEELERAWRSLLTRCDSERASKRKEFSTAAGIREQILDELVKLRVVLTANLARTVAPN